MKGYKHVSWYFHAHGQVQENLQTKRKVKHLLNRSLKRELFCCCFSVQNFSNIENDFLSRLKKKQRFNLWRQKFMASLHARGVEIEEVSFSFLLPCFFHVLIAQFYNIVLYKLKLELFMEIGPCCHTDLPVIKQFIFILS